MENEKTHSETVHEYLNEHFRVSHRELDLCHQISEESVSNSSHEDHAGGNEKVEWLYKEKTGETHNEIYHAKF
jgi:hypothetical protein